MKKIAYKDVSATDALIIIFEPLSSFLDNSLLADRSSLSPSPIHSPFSSLNDMVKM